MKTHKHKLSSFAPLSGGASFIPAHAFSSPAHRTSSPTYTLNPYSLRTRLPSPAHAHRTKNQPSCVFSLKGIRKGQKLLSPINMVLLPLAHFFLGVFAKVGQHIHSIFRQLAQPQTPTAMYLLPSASGTMRIFFISSTSFRID
jgi:hypothetical protein